LSGGWLDNGLGRNSLGKYRDGDSIRCRVTVGVKIKKERRSPESRRASSPPAGGKVGLGRASGQRCEGVFKIDRKNIDYINVISVTSQYEVKYFVDYLVKSPERLGKTDRKKTNLTLKKNSFIRGKVVDIEWKGDYYLSRVLNLDYQIKDRLLQTEIDRLKEGISIIPEPKYGYARIRISYLLPSSDLFEAINNIAKHVKSAW